MDTTIKGLTAFSYAWNRERDNKSSKIKAFARAVKAISDGIKITPDNLRSMQRDHPKSIFSRSIATNPTLGAMLQYDIESAKHGNITAIKSHKYDSRTKKGEANFYNNFSNYIFAENDAYAKPIRDALEEMKSKGREAKNFQLSGRGGVVDGRHFVEVVLDNGHPCLMYRSTGTFSGSETEGEWVPFPGWNENISNNRWFWFIKHPNSDRSDPKINKYKIPAFQQIAAFIKEREQILFPNLNKKDASDRK